MKQKKWIRLTLLHLPLHLHLSIPLGTVTQSTGPPGPEAWARARTAPFLVLPPLPHPSLGAPSHPYEASLVCVSLMNSLLTLPQQESRWNPGKIYSTYRKKAKEGRGQFGKKKKKKREYQMHSQNVPLAGELKLRLTFAHFSNLSLIELRFQTAGRLSGECSRGRRERVREIDVSEERLNLCSFS